MSASEKLLALERAMAYDSATDRATFVAGRDAEHAILRALPQVRALVEAAEIAQPVMELALRQSGINATPGHMLREALAALDESLP